jgi:hypothetical protein
VLNASQIRARPKGRSYSVEIVAGDVRWVMRLHFDPRYRPTECWSYQQLGSEGQSEPPDDLDLRVPVNPFGLAEYEFPPIKRGEEFGIAWRRPG